MLSKDLNSFIPSNQFDPELKFVVHTAVIWLESLDEARRYVYVFYFVSDSQKPMMVQLEMRTEPFLLLLHLLK
jgi:hypothetical protein